MMDRSSALDYVYAQASGKLAKSFIGKRARQLFEARTLQDLWLMVFTSTVPLVPEAVLAQQIETQAGEKFIADYMVLLGKFLDPPQVLLALLRIYDFSNLKKINFALRSNQSALPALTDIGKYSMLYCKDWPDMKRMTRGSTLSWVTEPVKASGVRDFERQLDQQYVHELWEAVEKLPSGDRYGAEKLIGEELIIENIIWALRLKVYYNMKNEEIIPSLGAAGCEPKKNDALAGKAVRVLDKAVDSFADWEKWDYSFLLNPHEEGTPWIVDPRWMQRAANVYLNRLALKLFHQQPGIGSLVSWFKIKQHELDVIRTAAEGLRLNVEPQALKEFTGTE